MDGVTPSSSRASDALHDFVVGAALQNWSATYVAYRKERCIYDADNDVSIVWLDFTRIAIRAHVTVR